MTLGTHRAAVCIALDGPESVVTQDVADEVIGAGAIRVAVRAAGVNFPDYLLTRGEYQLKLAPPFTPGMEVAGVVTETGPSLPESRPWPIGTPVIAVSRLGGFADEIVVANDAAFALPERFSYAEGATFLIAAHTAYASLATPTMSRTAPPKQNSPGSQEITCATKSPCCARPPRRQTTVRLPIRCQQVSST